PPRRTTMTRRRSRLVMTETRVSTGPLLLTMDEAAIRLRSSRRSLQDWLAAHPTDPAGVPYYVPNGRRKLFAEADIARILAAKREDEARRIRERDKCRGSSSRRVKAKRITGTSVESTAASLWTTARELLMSERRSASSKRGVGSQNVVS